MFGLNAQEFAKRHTLMLLALLAIGLVMMTVVPALAQTSSTWMKTGNMNTARIKHSATLLQNGQVWLLAA